MAAAGTWKSTRGRSPAHSAACPSLRAICRIVCSCTAVANRTFLTSHIQPGTTHC